jgi:putative transposase
VCAAAAGCATTIPGKDGQPARDLLNRAFTAPAPNRVWIAGLTYVGAWTGFVYVAFVVDVFAHWIIAWHASNRSSAAEGTIPPARRGLTSRPMR